MLTQKNHSCVVTRQPCRPPQANVTGTSPSPSDGSPRPRAGTDSRDAGLRYKIKAVPKPAQPKA